MRTDYPPFFDNLFSGGFYLLFNHFNKFHRHLLKIDNASSFVASSARKGFGDRNF